MAHAANDICRAAILPGVGLPLILGGMALFTVTEYALSVAVVALLVVWRFSRLCLFPLLSALIPTPSRVSDKVGVVLQRGSAKTTYRLFKAASVPNLPRRPVPSSGYWGLRFEVTEECSGIRSTLSLFIRSIIVGYLFLGSSLNWAVFAFVTTPVSVFTKCGSNCYHLLAGDLRRSLAPSGKTPPLRGRAILASRSCGSCGSSISSAWIGKAPVEKLSAGY